MASPSRDRGPCCLLSIAFAVSWGSRAIAEEASVDSAPQVATAAEQGAFLPWSHAAGHEHARGAAQLLGGFDSAARAAVFRAVADATVLGPLGVRAGVTYDGTETAARPFVGGRLDVLRERDDGFALSLHGRFQADGFNTVPEVAAGVAGAKAVGDFTLLANAEYGHGLADEERNAAGGLALVQHSGKWVRVGADSRFQIDLERDTDEPEDEPDWRLQAGPLLLVTLGSFCVSAGGGLTALRYRLSSTDHLGAVAYAGLGAVF
jgi:hypothetical protein